MTVFSPKELFIKFSYDHCDGLSIGTRGMAWGFGARYDIDGLTQLMKLLPYSCMNDVTQLIKNSVDEDYKKAYGNSPPQPLPLAWPPVVTTKLGPIRNRARSKENDAPKRSITSVAPLPSHL